MKNNYICVQYENQRTLEGSIISHGSYWHRWIDNTQKGDIAVSSICEKCGFISFLMRDYFKVPMRKRKMVVDVNFWKKMLDKRGENVRFIK